jgi:hypothetical protein
MTHGATAAEESAAAGAKYTGQYLNILHRIPQE